MSEPEKVTIDQATFYDKRFNFSTRLGVNSDPDKTMLLYYLQQRLLKASIYDSSFFLAHPIALAALQSPLGRKFLNLADQLDREKRKKLDALEEQTDDYIARNYQNALDRTRARTIELAINDVVAQATNSDPTAKSVRFEADDILLENWASKWRPAIHQ